MPEIKAGHGNSYIDRALTLGCGSWNTGGA